MAELKLTGCPRCKAPANHPHTPGCDFAGGMVPGTGPADYHDAVHGVGPLAAQWKDKPHRLVIDLKDEAIKLQAEVARLRLANAGAVEALESISAADLDEMDKSLGWAYSAMLVRKALASLKRA